MKPPTRRVLGMFAKRPDAGQVKTRLAKAIGDHAAAELSAAFIRDLLTEFADVADERWIGYAPADAAGYFAELTTGCYRIWPQPTGDLGTRIEAFFAAALSTPGTAAVLIGSDSPTLPCEYVAEAFQLLQTHDVVLGPATDGGYYLIGQRVMSRGWLNGVRWSDSATLNDTSSRAHRQGWSLAYTPPFFDVDTADDLATLAEHLRQLRSKQPARPISQTEAWFQRHANPAT